MSGIPKRPVLSAEGSLVKKRPEWNRERTCCQTAALAPQSKLFPFLPNFVPSSLTYHFLGSHYVQRISRRLRSVSITQAQELLFRLEHPFSLFLKIPVPFPALCFCRCQENFPNPTSSSSLQPSTRRI